MMLNKKLIVLVSLLMMPIVSYSNYDPVTFACRPFYIGVTGGYGTTTWGQLVPDEQNSALSVSTPIGVSEGGGVWGLYGGYEFLPMFALEGSFMRYPVAHLKFDPTSLFTFYHDGQTEIDTNTDSISLVAKIMLHIPCTRFRAYSSFGAAGVHRYDDITDRWRLSPTFGAGFNFLISPRLMMEIGTEYVAGYGQSEIEPAEHYVPFLYSGFARLAYRF